MKTKTKLLVIFVGALLAIGMVSNAFGQITTLINFDDVPDGTVVDSFYAARGVTFSNPIGGSIYARNGSGFAPSPPNVVSIFQTGFPDYWALYGAVDATFSTPQLTVSIDARPVATFEPLGTPQNRPFLEAYSGNTFLGGVYYSGALPTNSREVGPTETLTFTSSTANITRARFSVQQNAGGPRITGLFDNLGFRSEPLDGYAVLHSFADADGSFPFAGLIQGPDGTLYGTAVKSNSTLGTVYRMLPDGSSFTVLHSFTGAPTDGYVPIAALFQGVDGTLYGTTQGGGSANMGTIFQISPDGSGYASMYSFTGMPTDGASPQAALIQGLDGLLYGTTQLGGSANRGTIFNISPDGSSYTLLHSFTGGPTDGANADAGLIQGPDGTLYGTTAGGGTSNQGTIFQISPDGSSYSVLYAFTGTTTDGNEPRCALIQGLDGLLYGTTQLGGSSNRGTIFNISPDGTAFTLLHSFTGGPADGANAIAGLFQSADGTLYGTTFAGGAVDGGTIFKMAPDGNGFTLMHSFASTGNDGRSPEASLIQSPDGTLYGTTNGGGSFNRGTIFKINP